ncbi:MAG: deoxyribodipyrimidine photo-lyase [Nanoarchaeota archaeon]|nr:deoxyribodipyrimidine photo-lyase [Nanoarchaeota archaeon]
MEKKYKKSIYIFRRDYRLYDNTSLIKALEESEEVIPIFILNPKQVTNENEFYNKHSIQFLFESLKDLNEQLKGKESKLHLFYGKQLEILKDLVNKHNIEAIYQNKDYTPFARKRDQSIKELCSKLEVDCNLYHDYLLNSPKEVLKGDGDPYGVFTPYYKRASMHKVHAPKENDFKNYSTVECESIEILDKILPQKNKEILVEGGREEALKIIDSLGFMSNYQDQRDFPSVHGTSRLSAHLKFGTISCRELYYLLEEKIHNPENVRRQLHWRDFWTYIAYHNPKVFKTSYIDKYSYVAWMHIEKDEKTKKNWLAWCEGKTGFPIVDAGMRELNTTGFMHNRVRMIVASFLTKDLHISYKEGEKYFGQQLTDYDPCLNNGNWQWAASTGCDGQPYFRIFNPWRQQERFDKECEYIKHWIPELKELTPKQIHNYYKKNVHVKGYPYPIVIHEKETPYAKDMFKSKT